MRRHRKNAPPTFFDKKIRLEILNFSPVFSMSARTPESTTSRESQTVLKMSPHHICAFRDAFTRMSKSVWQIFRKKVSMSDSRLPEDGQLDDCNKTYFGGELDLSLGNDLVRHETSYTYTNTTHERSAVFSGKQRVVFAVCQAKMD